MTAPSVGQKITASWGTAIVNALTGVAVAHEYATHSAAITTTTSVFTTVTGWAGSTVGFAYANGIWTVNTAGYYLGHIRMTWPNIASPTGQRVVRVIYNGSTWDEWAEAPNASINTPVLGSFGMALAVGDTISFQIMQSQGSSVATIAGTQFNFVYMTYVSPT